MTTRLMLPLLLALLTTAMALADDSDLLLNETFPTTGTIPAGWRAEGPGWKVADGSLVVDSTAGLTRILVGRPDWQDYEITVTATFDRVADPSRWLSVVFRADPAGTAPWPQFALRFECTKPNGAEFAVRTAKKSWRIRAQAKLPVNCELGQPRRLRVVVHGTDVAAYVDGRRAWTIAFCTDRETGCVGLAAAGCVARFDDFRVRRLPPAPRLSELPLRPCEVVAHRGFSAVAPENTLASLSAAIRAGATGSECDVYTSKDGQIVVMHDGTVDRTTNGNGKITELTFAQLRQLDAGSWKHKKYAGERIPTLDEILATHRGTRCAAVVEIKMAGIERPVIEAIRRAGLIDQAFVISFKGDVVREVRTLEPRLRCAWLCGETPKSTSARRAEWLAAKAKEYKTNILDLGYSLLSRETVAELHRRGIVVWAYTVDEPSVIDALMRWGVDSITTNRPDRVLALVRKTTAPTSPTR